jgi:hypothetical protein
VKISGPTISCALGLLGLLAPPVSLRAQTPEPGAAPPWSVESPGAAGAPFVLGLDVASGRTDGLRISSQASVVTLRDLTTGTSETTAIPGDPSLLNRKFSIRIRATGEGAQTPIALPRIPVAAGVSLFPTLVVQAASTDLALDFIDKPERADSTSLRGRAPLYGLGFSLAAPLCQGCPWFASAGYRFSTLRGLAAERSPSFNPPGFDVLQDRSRLSLRRDEEVIRIGRGLPGGRVVVHFGLLRSRDLLAEDDTVELASRQVEQTLLSSRTKLATNATAGLAGIEARVAGPLLMRVEAVFGSGRDGVALKLAWIKLPPVAPPPYSEPTSPPDRPQEEVAAQILRGLEPIRAELARRVASLETVRPDPAGPVLVSATAVAQLIDDMERELLAALWGQELAALRDYVRYVFQGLRQALHLSATTVDGAQPRASVAQASFRPALRAAHGAAPAGDDRGITDRERDLVQCTLVTLIEKKIMDWARRRQLQLNLIVVSRQEPAFFKMAPYSDRSKRTTRYGYIEGRRLVLQDVWRGLYWYKVERAGFKPPDEDQLLLVGGSPRAIHCILGEISKEGHTLCEPDPLEPGGKECSP